jgi:ABC-2 type transport system ATP-binding protein
MGTPAIRTEGLSKRYGSADALLGLDLQIAEGEVVGYLGPNGAGKTTTIRLLLGLARPTAGRAEIFGLDCQRRAVEAHRRLAYVPGEASLWPSLTGAETLHLLGRVQGRADTAYRDELIERFDLDPSKKVRAYSKGNKQKVLLIAALMTRPDLLVLDEPTSGLDPLMEQAFRRSMAEARQAGQTVFLSSHILSEVEAWLSPLGWIEESRPLTDPHPDATRGLYAWRLQRMPRPGGRWHLYQLRYRGPASFERAMREVRPVQAHRRTLQPRRNCGSRSRSATGR